MLILKCLVYGAELLMWRISEPVLCERLIPRKLKDEGERSVRDATVASAAGTMQNMIQFQYIPAGCCVRYMWTA